MTAEHADPSGSAVSVIEYEVQEGEAGDAGIIIIIIIIIVIIGQERQAATSAALCASSLRSATQFADSLLLSPLHTVMSRAILAICSIMLDHLRHLYDDAA